MLTASDRGLCLFEALKCALGLLGDPVGVPDAAMEEFREGARARGVQLECGLRWTTFAAFVRLLSKYGSLLSQDTITKNLQVSGRRRKVTMSDLKLANGIYMVGAFNTDRVGHTFVLEVCGGASIVHGEPGHREFELHCRWVENISFVRKVELAASFN